MSTNLTTLLSEQNTAKVERLVRTAAAVQFGRGRARRYYEHGHWWVILAGEDGAEMIFDVVDSSPSVADTGLSFERVS